MQLLSCPEACSSSFTYRTCDECDESACFVGSGLIVLARSQEYVSV